MIDSNVIIFANLLQDKCRRGSNLYLNSVHLQGVFMILAYIYEVLCITAHKISLIIW